MPLSVEYKASKSRQILRSEKGDKGRKTVFNGNKYLKE